MSGPRTKNKQVYAVSMFVFIPEQLSAVSDSVYTHLTQDVRLHTPKVRCAYPPCPAAGQLLEVWLHRARRGAAGTPTAAIWPCWVQDPS